MQLPADLSAITLASLTAHRMARRTRLYPRDLIGYGRTPPDPRWPGGARIAVQFVVNYEEGGERSILHGDRESETYLYEVVGLTPRKGRRDENVESVYEYGSRAGFWRIMRLFDERKLHFTSYAVGMALARHPDAGRAMVEAGHEVASHGRRWIDDQKIGIAEERRHMRRAIEAISKACGVRPVGWYTGRLSGNTRTLVVEDGGFLYDSDACNDDLLYRVTVDGKGHLVIPYTLDNNDTKFGTAQGFNTGQGFFTYLREPSTRSIARAKAAAQGDVRRPAYPSRRAPEPHRRPRAVPRSRAAPRQGVDLPARRYRPSLGRGPSLQTAGKTLREQGGKKTSC